METISCRCAKHLSGKRLRASRHKATHLGSCGNSPFWASGCFLFLQVADVLMKWARIVGMILKVPSRAAGPPPHPNQHLVVEHLYQCLKSHNYQKSAHCQYTRSTRTKKEQGFFFPGSIQNSEGLPLREQSVSSLGEVSEFGRMI